MQSNLLSSFFVFNVKSGTMNNLRIKSSDIPKRSPFSCDLKDIKKITSFLRIEKNWFKFLILIQFFDRAFSVFFLKKRGKFIKIYLSETHVLHLHLKISNCFVSKSL